MSRALLSSYGMDFLDEDDDLLLGFVSEAAQKGRVVNGYQAKYVNRYYGTRLQNRELSDHLQIICNISANEEGTQELKSFDVHNIGSSVWKLSILNECTDEEKTYPGERKLIINKANGKEGLLVVNVMNADILPSYLPGEEVELQMIGVAVDVDYYKSRDEGDEKTPGEYKLADGFMCGTQFLYNHQVLPEGTVRDIDYSTNDWIAVRGTVKQAYLHKIMIDEENELTRYVETIIETDFGDLKISHSIDQIKEEQRDNTKPGSDFIGVIVLQGDALINKYENGIVFDYLFKDLESLEACFRQNNARFKKFIRLAIKKNSKVEKAGENLIETLVSSTKKVNHSLRVVNSSLEDLNSNIDGIMNKANKIMKSLDKSKILSFVNLGLNVADLCATVSGFMMISEHLDEIAKELSSVSKDVKGIVKHQEFLDQKEVKALINEYGNLLNKEKVGKKVSTEERYKLVDDMYLTLGVLIDCFKNDVGHREVYYDAISSMLPLYIVSICNFDRSHYFSYGCLHISHDKYVKMRNSVFFTKIRFFRELVDGQHKKSSSV